MAERTILDLFRADVASFRRVHLTHHLPGETRSLSSEQFLHQVAWLAEGLARAGVKAGDRVMLLCDNRPEWHVVDLAVMSLRAVDVPVYGTLTAGQVTYQARDSGAVAAVADTDAQMSKLLEARDSCPRLRLLIQVDGAPRGGVTALSDVVAEGKEPLARERFWRRAEEVWSDDLATVIYTSGTTGDAKGVMLTHGNLVANVLAAAPRVPVERDDLALEFLPLCHVFERMLGYVYMWRGIARAYCSVHHVADLIAAIRPTLFAGVPRFYEKVRDRAIERAGSSGPRAALFRWALGVGRRAAHRRIAGRTIEASLAAELALADRLVLSRIRSAMGARLRCCISGGAALSLEVAEFFHAAGIRLLEGYGLTETSPVIAVNSPAPGGLRLGTVGKPLDNLELKFAPDGELLVRGPSVTSGYWHKPEASAEAFDESGFFRTGDIAELDDGGFLLITDRKKDMIVTAGGKNVAPQPIESALARSPLVDAAVVVGDGRPAIVALLSPSEPEVRRVARALGLGDDPLPSLVAEPRIRDIFAAVVHEVNGGLARFEQLKTFRILPAPLSVESGLLTPTLKVRRRAIERTYASLIEEMFATR
ncbi:MAG: long-chain fatty acid--CoA ligase [Acidobacteriota bacterium]